VHAQEFFKDVPDFNPDPIAKICYLFWQDYIRADDLLFNTLPDWLTGKKANLSILLNNLSPLPLISIR
jgi:hypothetical protein